MVYSISQIHNVLRTYNKQLHIARLNSEEKQRTIQMQTDKVDISDEAQKLISEKTGQEKTIKEQKG